MALDVSAYYTRFDRSKNYKRHLFNDSKGFQSAEGNEIYDYSHDNLHQFANALVGDGAVLQGSLAHINEISSEVSLEEGSIVAEGYVIQFPPTTLAINDSDNFSLGIAILREVVTVEQDLEFKDPAVGTANYGQAGADRLKITGRWVFSDSYNPSLEQFYPIHKIIKGVLITAQPNASEDNLFPIVELVARYDRDSNGNYVANGMNVVYISEDATNYQHNLSIVEGLAHVFGYEVNFASDFQLKIDWAMDERFVNNEPISFTGDGWYELRNNPVARLGEVFGVKVITQFVSHGGYSGCQDELPQQPVVSIVSVIQGSTTFIAGTDYIQNGDHIDWSLSGAEPAPGTSYEVVWLFNDEISCLISEDNLSIQVLGLKVGTVFFCDYYYYLPRYDKINLLRDGTIFITKGLPADEDEIMKPVNNEGLPLATVKVYYGREPLIEYEGYRTLKMSDLADMQKQISELRYNLSRISQMEDLSAKDPTTNKKNMFVDPFFDDDLRDSGLPNDAIIMDGILNPSVVWQSNFLRAGAPILLDHTPTLIIDQTAYTKTRKVNEFDYAEIKTVIKCSPTSMRWISSTTGSGTSPTQVEDKYAAIPTNTLLTITGGKYAVGETVTIYIDSLEATTTIADNDGQIDITFAVPVGVGAGIKRIAAGGETSKAIGTTTFIASAIQQRTAVNTKIARAIASMEKKLSLSSFDRRYGEIPANLRAKARRHIANGYNSEKLWKHYQACTRGGKRSLDYCVRYDPLAQTFRVKEAGFISACKVFFTKIPSDPQEIVEVAIHGTQVGIPDRDELLVNLELFSEQLTANAWNTFEFEYPILLEADVEYAMVVFSRDTDTFIRTAEIGGFDLEHNTWLSSQVHGGVLLQSANRSTWNAIPKEDMTFQIEYADFSLTKEVYLGELSFTAVTDVNLTATAEILANTEVIYRVELIDRLPSNEIIALNPGKTAKIVEYTGTAKFYAILSTTDSRLSPTVDGDINITTGQVVFPSDYISRQFNIDGNNLNAYVDIFEPNNSIVNLYYQDYTAATGDLGGEILITANITLGESGNFLVEIIHDPLVLDASSTFAVWDDTLKKVVVHIKNTVSTQNDIATALTTDTSIQITTAIPDNPGQIWIMTDPANDTVTLSDGDRWKLMTRNPTESTPIGEGWTDTLFEADVSGLSKMRMRVELNTTEEYNRPYCENLRTYVY